MQCKEQVAELNDGLSCKKTCDHCGYIENEPNTSVRTDLGTHGTENICVICLENYDPYKGY